jgi:hypothetical protein
MSTATLAPTPVPGTALASTELSGPQWTSRFPGSSDTASLEPGFRNSVESFIKALRDAGVSVVSNATYRPPARSYLMHWSWMIVHGTDPTTVPAMDGVNINWVHPTNAASVTAAQQMVNAYGMANLHTPPALHSLHNEGQAIDMDISWTGSIAVEDATGTTVDIATTPQTGMNPLVIQVGASYGVIKFVGGDADKPHWSTNGH